MSFSVRVAVVDDGAGFAVDDGAGGADVPLRLPVQWVVRADGFRGYSGTVASGVIPPVNRYVFAGEYSAPKGELIVTAPILFGRLHVLPVTTEFLNAYPDVDVRLLFGDRNLNLLDDHVATYLGLDEAWLANADDRAPGLYDVARKVLS
jgi:hypothetical protein